MSIKSKSPTSDVVYEAFEPACKLVNRTSITLENVAHFHCPFRLLVKHETVARENSKHIQLVRFERTLASVVGNNTREGLSSRASKGSNLLVRCSIPSLMTSPMLVAKYPGCSCKGTANHGYRLARESNTLSARACCISSFCHVCQQSRLVAAEFSLPESGRDVTE